MLWFKACPKCQGDLALQQDVFGNYVGCLQCGFILAEDAAARLLKQPITKELAAVGRPEDERIRTAA
jgi:hypothetical protein